jgi:hypothetical protein
MAVIDELKQALISPFLNLSSKDVQGLLQPQQTKLQAGLLGALQGVQPYMGYTTTPVSFGQAAVSALTGAAGGLQQKQESDLARALQGLQLYSALGDDDDTEFQQNVKRFNKIDAIPEGERSQSEKNEYSILQNKLLSKGKDTETTSYLKYGVLKKIADGVKPDELSSGEKEIWKLIQRDEDPLSQILKLAAGDESPIIPTKPEPEPEEQINISEMSDQELANAIKNEKDKDKQLQIFESLPEERKYEVAPLL